MVLGGRAADGFGRVNSFFLLVDGGGEEKNRKKRTERKEQCFAVLSEIGLFGIGFEEEGVLGS